jgi:hypothetical protein
MRSPGCLPVVVALKTAPDLNLAEPPVKTSISKITTGGFHLQVTVQIRPDLRPAALDAEITRILIAERILRNHAEITTKRSMVLPDWLLTGISQAMTFRDRSRPSAVFAAIFRSGKIYGIEEILDTAPGELDALSRTLYETSCCALVLALLDQVDGPMRLRTFLSMLGRGLARRPRFVELLLSHSCSFFLELEQVVVSADGLPRHAHRV